MKSIKPKTEWRRLERVLRDYVAVPLFAGADSVGLTLARTIWGVWFVFLCLLTWVNFRLCQPITDGQFWEWVGLTSALAILCTRRPTTRSTRLHCLMLVLSCLVYFGLQKPTTYTPHGTFLHTFNRVETGMTTDHVRALMFSYQASDGHYKRQRVFVNSTAARQWWFQPTYSGRLRFSSPDPAHVGGGFDVAFRKGKVVSTYRRNK